MAEMQAIEIPQMTTQTAVIPIKGLSPLIMHKWSEKAKKQMLDNMQGKKKGKAVSYTHLTLPTIAAECRSRWSPYH